MGDRNRFTDTQEALDRALNSREGFLEPHDDELRALIDGIGLTLNITPDEQLVLRRAATLHDLGKLGVAPDLLHSARHLTDSEREQLSSYPAVSARLLAEVPGMEEAAIVVRHLNEKWDGSGHPEQLTGEQIPYSSRVLAVVVAYQAMSSARPHRAAMHPKAILDELKRASGSLFDPAVVDALLAMIRPHAGSS